eukprot:4203940-Pyramimonas_sp.AAC.1
MEMGCKLYKKWKNRQGGDADKHFVSFDEEWNSLTAFALADPPVEIDCEFLWRTNITLKEPFAAPSLRCCL